jgi:hypothetical protein
MPFLDNNTCIEGGYLFLPRFSSLYDAIHGWMDEWKKLHEKQPRRPLTMIIYINSVSPYVCDRGFGGWGKRAAGEATGGPPLPHYQAGLDPAYPSIEVLKPKSHLSVCRGLETQILSIYLSRS